MVTKIKDGVIDPSVWIDLELPGSPTAPHTLEVGDDSKAVANAEFVQLVMSTLSGLISTALAGKQNLDQDLTDIATQGTTLFGRGFLNQVDGPSTRTKIGAQAANNNLTALSALVTTAYGLGLSTLANNAALLAEIGYEVLPDWVPTLTTGGEVGRTYATQIGKLTRIGRVRFASFDVQLSALGTSTGSAFIGGLPAPVAALGAPQSISISRYENFTGLTGTLLGWINANTQSPALMQHSATGSTAITHAVLTATSRVVGSFTYIV